MPQYHIKESRDVLTREPLFFIVRDNKEIPMKFKSHHLAMDFMKILQEDDERKNVGAKRPAA